MKIQRIILALAFVSFLAVSCKNEAKKEDVKKETKTEVAANTKEISLSISGMTCEIGCARKIASDLSKKEGVLEAKVIFNDSIANVKYDANVTNKADLISFVQGIGSGEMYKATETAKKECKAKTDAEKKECKKKTSCKEGAKDKKACASDCQMACCTDTDAGKKVCASDCKKDCCPKTKEA